MTKHVADEGFPKYHMPLEEANKIIEDNIKMLDHQAFAICGPSLSSEQSAETKIHPSKAKMHSLKSRLGKIVHKMYDLEQDNAPEKPLNVDLGVDLYQMENF